MASDATFTLQMLNGLQAVATSPAGERRLGKGKPLALLAFLSLTPGRSASRERLATLLWSDGSSDQARQNLRQTIWYLKRRLGDIIQTDDDNLTLHSAVTSDVDEFLECIKRSDHRGAITRYAGDFVPEFAAPGAAGFEDWADLERRRLRALFVTSCEVVCRELLGSGNASEAVHIARQARDAARSDQAAWRLLLEALIAARDPLGAAAEVALLEGAVERDDLELDAPTQALLRTVKRVAAGTTTQSDDPPATDPTQIVPDLIGRESEFRTLVDAWETTRRGRGRTILLTGAAGLGKSRLLDDFGARITSTRGRAVSVRAHPGNRSISGSLVTDLAEQLAALPGSAAISPSSAGVLLALSPRLASTYRASEPDRTTGEDATRRRVSALGELLEMITETAPLALLIDDAHWADGESLRIIGALSAKVERLRLLLVVAGRVPEQLGALMSGAEELPLLPLDVAGVAEFVGRLASLPTESWSKNLIPRLHQVSHGIPLLLIETLQRLLERGALSRVDGQWETKSAESLAEAMPAVSALRERLQSLTADERTVLLRLAILGRPISASLLTADAVISDWATHLQSLAERNFVRSSAGLVSPWHDEIALGIMELASPEARLAAHGWAARVAIRDLESSGNLSFALSHALRSADDRLLESIWYQALERARGAGDTRSLSVLTRSLLSAEWTTERERQLVRATPLRFRLRWPLRLAAAAVLLLAVVGGLAMSEESPAEIPYLIVSGDGSGSVYEFRVDPSARWVVNEPIEAVPAGRGAPRLPLLDGTSDWVPVPGEERWVGTMAIREAGGDEDLVLVNARGAQSRPVPALGDDGGVQFSPDGQQMVFSSRRYDRVEHQADLVIWDRRSGSLTRATRTIDDEVSAIWSPDGTRLAFSRLYFSAARAPTACVMSVDGRGERCLGWRDLPENVRVVTWLDDDRLLVQQQDSLELFALTISTARALALGRVNGVLSPAPPGSPILCQCSHETERESHLAFVLPTSPTLPRPIIHNTRPLTWRRLAQVGAPIRRHLARIAVMTPDSSLALDGVTSARVAGFDAEDKPHPIRSISFRTSDSLTLVVDPDGTIHPKSLGTAWLIASAGGWRQDSTRIRVIEQASQIVIAERWERGISPQWRGFGDPAPRTATADGRTVLTPAGDGIFATGVYLRQDLRGARGAGVEIQSKLPFNKLKLQYITLSLTTAANRSAVDAWDHRTAFGAVMDPPGCGTRFPSGEGGLGWLRFLVSSIGGGPNSAYSEAPADFYGENWHTIRLQLFPDGRCGLAVDGKVVALTPLPARTPPSLRLTITGSAVGALPSVGNVTVWEGVRRDLDWSVRRAESR